MEDNINYLAQHLVCCTFKNKSMESYKESYDSDGNLPCYDLQAFDEDPDDFEEDLLGGDRLLMPEITQVKPITQAMTYSLDPN